MESYVFERIYVFFSSVCVGPLEIPVIYGNLMELRKRNRFMGAQPLNFQQSGQIRLTITAYAVAKPKPHFNFVSENAPSKINALKPAKITSG